jgi:methylated-DNA-[protein]-cysteine S-methyltransferase
MKRKCSISTPLGRMTGLADGDGLRGLWFAGQRYEPEMSPDWVEEPDYPVFAALRGQLDAYFGGKLRSFDLPIALDGTPFRVAVWTLLRDIPVGTTTTYGALAGRLAASRGGRAPSAQAVGGAVGHNPISIIVPCHRVIGSNGSLTGYAGGLDRKAALLAIEKAEVRDKPPVGRTDHAIY